MLPQIALHDPVFRADFFISDFPRNSRRGAQFSAFRFGKRNSVDFRDVLVIGSYRGNRVHSGRLDRCNWRATGGLSISVIKREVGTKDMAATVPGHGGILDQIESLIIAEVIVHAHGWVL